MSSRNRQAARPGRQSATHSQMRRDLPTGLARWLVIAAGLALAGAALMVFMVKEDTGDLRPKTGTTLEKEQAPLVTGTNRPVITSVVTNQIEAEVGEDRIVALVTEGNEFLAQGNYAEAAQRYEQAMRVEPGDEVLHYNLAIALAKLGKTEEAKKHYAEALEIYPEYSDAHNNLGNLLMMEHKLAEASDHFREAVRMMPDNASFHNNLGTVLGLQSKTGEAIVEFEVAIKLKPDYVDARVNLANACLAEGRVEEAVAQLNEALRLKPDSQPAIQTMHRVRQRRALPNVPGNP